MSRVEIGNPADWRVSRSGYSIKTGWDDDTRIVASYPGPITPFDAARYEQWLEDAELICRLHNKEPQPAAKENDHAE